MVYRPMNLPQGIQAQYYRDPRLRLSGRLMDEGTSTAPVQHWTQGLGRLAQALAGTYIGQKMDREYEQRGQKYADDLSSLFAPVELPATEMDPVGGQRPASYADMLKRAQTVRNPDLGPMLQSLALQSAGEAAEEGRFNRRFQMERGAKREDMSAQQDFQREMADIQQKFQMGILTQQQAFQAAEAARNRAAQMDIAKLSASKPTGTPVAVPDANSPTGFTYRMPTEISGQPAMDPARLRRGNDKLPTPALKLQNEALDAIGTAAAMNADLGAFGRMLAEGKLSLGLGANIESRGRNFLGMSDENSRNFASFKANLERLRNESLRLNKGVQTEGDAVRAWNEMFESINDPQVVMQRLADIQRINDRGAQLRQLEVDNIRANYGLDPLDTSAYRNQPAAFGQGGGAWSIQRVE